MLTDLEFVLDSLLFIMFATDFTENGMLNVENSSFRVNACAEFPEKSGFVLSSYSFSN